MYTGMAKYLNSAHVLAVGYSNNKQREQISLQEAKLSLG